MDSTTITSVSNQDSNNNQNQNQLRDQEQSLKSNFDFLENQHRKTRNIPRLQKILSFINLSYHVSPLETI